ncbi:MAG: thymidylate kinase, partial [Candidatus Eisenbacteria bacterium]|nr:thymidylate kinase [Candidatus Eisenbacteria bacterium]
MRTFQTYGEVLPRVSLSDLSGWLIVVEGTDGVGRTTHINRLRAHLERLGYAVAETGLSRSDLASRG